MSTLDTLLAQVPYQNRTRVKQDILMMTSKYRALLPKVGTLIHNDGTESKLLLLSGTIPISYMGVQYHIPVELYTPEAYPTVTPKIYVRPTNNMIVKPSHRHVDMQGEVFLPYLHEWKPASSNMMDLVTIMCTVFSQDPPLFSKPANSAAAAASGGSGTVSSSATTMAARHSMSGPNAANPSSMQNAYQRMQVGPTGGAGPTAVTTVAATNVYSANPNGSSTIQYGSATTVSASPAYRNTFSGPASGYPPTSGNVVTATPYNAAGGASPYPSAAAASPYPGATTVTAVGVGAAGAGYARAAYGSGNSAMANAYQQQQHLPINSTNSASSGGSSGYHTVGSGSSGSGPVGAGNAAVMGLNYSAYGNMYNGSSSNNAAAANSNNLLKTAVGPSRRQQLEQQLTLKLQEEMTLQLTDIAADIDKEMETQQELATAKDAVVPQQLEELTREEFKMKQQITEMETKLQALNTWGEEMGAKAEIDCEEKLTSFDDVSAQLIKLIAEQNAIDDAIYYLDYALAHGVKYHAPSGGSGAGASSSASPAPGDASVDINTFLKETRKLARKQFLCKVHVMKINAQLQQTAAASAAPPSYGSNMAANGYPSLPPGYQQLSRTTSSIPTGSVGRPMYNAPPPSY